MVQLSLKTVLDIGSLMLKIRGNRSKYLSIYRDGEKLENEMAGKEQNHLEELSQKSYSFTNSPS